jgi:dTDP-4-dehydrorhamnose 3,5-epimerase
VKLEPTGLAGLFVVRPETHADSRGGFARLFCAEEFTRAGSDFLPRQISVSVNRMAGTLRGLHWQSAPHAETKLVSVSRGRIWDVAVDLRAHSPTRLAWFGLELDAANHLALLIPPGCAHGFVTLTDDTELLYCIDEAYHPEAAQGARYDDAAVGITWPCVPAVMAERDLGWPSLGNGGVTGGRIRDFATI